MWNPVQCDECREYKCVCKPKDYELICPDCGATLTLLGEFKGLTLKVTGGGAQCPECPYEDKW